MSVALHVTVMTGVSWRLPEPVIEAPPLEARLMPVTPPAIQPAPPAPGMPAQAPATSSRKPKVIATAPTPTRVRRLPTPFLPRPTAKGAAGSGRRDRRHAAANPATAAVATAPPDISPPEEAPLPQLPRRGRISYTLYVGMQKFEVAAPCRPGKSKTAATASAASSETTGVVNVLRSERRTYLSVGKVTRDGLRPTSFS